MSQRTTDPGAAKRAVLDHLKRNGPSDAAQIGAALGVTAMAVRQHLYALEDDGFVSFTTVSSEGTRGRPAKLWRIEESAQTIFPDAHAELSVELINNIKQAFGPRGLDRLIVKRT